MKIYSHILCVYAYAVYTYIRLQTCVYSWVEAGHNEQKIYYDIYTYRNTYTYIFIYTYMYTNVYM